MQMQCSLNTLISAIPREIKLVNLNRRWVELEEKEEKLQKTAQKIPMRAGLLLWLPNGLNSNDSTRTHKIYGKTSPLFDVSHDDQLLDQSLNLMQSRANPNFPTEEGYTPFERAIRSNALATAWAMIDFGADCKLGLLVIADHACRTQDAILFAAQKKLLERMVQRLKEQEKSVDVTDIFGETPLMKLTQLKSFQQKIIEVPVHFRMELASVLIKNGADPRKKEDYGQLALEGESAIDRAKKRNLAGLLTVLNS